MKCGFEACPTFRACASFHLIGYDEVAVLGVASTSDGALLYEGAQWLDSNKSHNSYEYAMQISDISVAIDQCVSTAFSTWSPRMQKALLKAAHFGMVFSTGFDSTRFVRTLRELRVLNEVHRERTGMPITSVQIDRILRFQSLRQVYFCYFLSEKFTKRAIDAKLPKLARLLIKREKDDSKQSTVVRARAVHFAAAQESPSVDNDLKCSDRDAEI
ncbi:hypothetical protein KIN20_038309 [Parelaphostrongylus tenuis]|uniref:Vps16 N-terminal domain-containing protein n=1 Tax=Parelaphostrongylus tenuis TaxID=148309 RepID=A0AAD5RF56_PARTN|nr:hypothetical protein KIN20_038309 [Parelaphostrongylus tenuis]